MQHAKLIEEMRDRAAQMAPSGTARDVLMRGALALETLSREVEEKQDAEIIKRIDRCHTEYLTTEQTEANYYDNLLYIVKEYRDAPR